MPKSSERRSNQKPKFTQHYVQQMVANPANKTFGKKKKKKDNWWLIVC